MPDLTPLAENPFAVLSFLAAPAILTNAATLLAMSTSNRLARAADRARAASALVLESKELDQQAMYNRNDFHHSTRRAEMLVRALGQLYLATACFAGAVCVALVGAFAGYFHVVVLPLVLQVLTILLAVVGVGAMVSASAVLVAETRLALSGLADLHASITQWRATRPLSDEPKPGTGLPGGDPPH